MAETLLRLDRGPEAEEAFAKAQTGADDPMIKGLVKHALASAAREKGDFAKAEQLLRELSTDQTMHYPQDIALYELAGVLDASGKTKEAEDTRQQIVREQADSPIYGMPILDVDKSGSVIVLKRSMNSGFAGIDNPLFYKENTSLLFGDAKESVGQVLKAVEDL